MAKIDPSRSGKSGNTKQISPARHWCFTLNNHTEEEFEQIQSSDKLVKYVMQEEVGENGTPHIQGYCDFGMRVRPKNLFSDRIHWEKCRNIQKSIAYCSKKDTRVKGPWTKGITLPKEIKDPIEVPRPWQKTVLELIEQEPDDRTIWWIYDKGNTGKTALCKHICLKRKDAIMVTGKAHDMKCAIASMEEKPNIVLMNFSRTQEGHISYQGIEEIKDGIFFSGKYESSMILMNSPHIFCFSNFMPDLDKLSEDRWAFISTDDSDHPEERIL